MIPRCNVHSLPRASLFLLTSTAAAVLAEDGLEESLLAEGARSLINEEAAHVLLLLACWRCLLMLQSLCTGGRLAGVSCLRMMARVVVGIEALWVASINVSVERTLVTAGGRWSSRQFDLC